MKLKGDESLKNEELVTPTPLPVEVHYDKNAGRHVKAIRDIQVIKQFYQIIASLKVFFTKYTSLTTYS